MDDHFWKKYEENSLNLIILRENLASGWSVNNVSLKA